MHTNNVHKVSLYALLKESFVSFFISSFLLFIIYLFCSVDDGDLKTEISEGRNEKREDKKGEARNDGKKNKKVAL